MIFFLKTCTLGFFPLQREFLAAAYQSYRRRRWCLKRSRREEISMIMFRWCVLMLWIGYPSFQNTLYISSSSSCPQKMLHVPVPCPRHGDEHGTQSIGLISHSLITAIDLFQTLKPLILNNYTVQDFGVQLENWTWIRLIATM